MEERPVPKGEVPGEWYSPTQLFPTKPPPFDQQGVTVDDLIDFTPELKAEALQMASQYQIGPIFTPQIVGGANGKRGFLMVPAATGAANWESAGIDPETGVIYIPSVTNLSVQALQPGGTRSNMNYISGAPAGGDPDAGPRPAAGPAGTTATAPAAGPAGTTPTAAAGGRGGAAPAVLGPGVTRGPWGIGPQGLPLLKPPYGRITAIDLNTGERLWQVANGDTYEWIKNHPALKGVNIPKTGKSDVGGVAVTKTLLFAGEGCGLFRSAGGGPMFYAYDKKTGDVVWEFKLPAGACGNPMTYMVNGKQYIAVATGARNTPAELVALTLP
jgi:quinoprotein glucose dehydrogenase